MNIFLEYLNIFIKFHLGLFFVIPCIDEYRKVDLRVVSFEVPPQELLSKDSVTANVDAVCFYLINLII